MLSSLREKLFNVKKNVNIFNTNDERPQKCNTNLNPNAGAEILSKYQDQWAEIHKSNEENAESAAKMAVQIDVMAKRAINDKSNAELITYILKQSNLRTNISNCLAQIQTLYDTCEKVERGLIVLEDLIEEKEFCKIKKQHSFHLKQYESRQQDALEEYKLTLENEHKKKIVAHEANKKKVSEERQRVFQEAFKTDLEIYKNLGTIPKVELPKKQSALLEEIQLDYDQNELDQFFNEN